MAAIQTNQDEPEREEMNEKPTGNGQNFGSNAYKKAKIKAIITGMGKVMSTASTAK